MVKLIFEFVETEVIDKKWGEANPKYQRAKVPTGWLVRNRTHGTPLMTFVPDPNHEWK